MEKIIEFIFCSICILFGGWSIGDAIRHYKKGWYMLCGIESMLVVMCICYLIKTTF